LGALRPKTTEWLVGQAIRLGFNVSPIALALLGKRAVGIEPATCGQAGDTLVPLLWRPTSDGQNGGFIAMATRGHKHVRFHPIDLSRSKGNIVAVTSVFTQ
jgi:hypothetical protein